MKKYLYFVLFSFLLFTAILIFIQPTQVAAVVEEPPYTWTHVVPGYIWGDTVVVDSNENIYVVGRSRAGTYNFGVGGDTASRTFTSNGAFTISKFTREKERLWTKSIDGEAASSAFVSELIVDSNDNLYFAGVLSGNITSGLLGTVSRSNNTMFLMKLNSDGELVFSNIADGGSSRANGLVLDDSGNIYLTGSFSGTVDFGTGEDSGSRTSSEGNFDGFVSKYQSDGTRVWTKTFGGTGNQEGNGVGFTSDGGVVVAGMFYTQADFGAGGDEAVRTAAGTYQNAFLSKYSTSGSRDWTFTYGAVDCRVNVRELSVNSTGIILTGSLLGTVNFGGDIGSITQSGLKPIILKFDNDGAGLLGIALSTTSWMSIDESVVDAGGNIYITGSFGGTIDLNPGGDPYNLTADTEWSDSMYFAAYDSSGMLLWAKTTSGGLETDSYGVYVRGDLFVVTGDVYGDADYNPDGEADIQHGDPDNGGLALTLYSYPLPTSTPTPTGSPTPTLTPTITPTRRPGGGYTPTSTPEPTLTPTVTPSVGVTASIVPTLPATGEVKSVTLKITGPDGNLILNASITIDGAAYKTNSSGEVVLKNVSTGTHEIKYIVNGQTYTQSFVLGTSTNTGATVNVNLQTTSNQISPLWLIALIPIAGVIYYVIKNKKKQ